MENISLSHQDADMMRRQAASLAKSGKPNHSTEIEISTGRVNVIEAGRRRQDVICCLQGSLWLTQTGDLNDYRLRTGEVFIAKKAGRILAYALKDARIEVTSTRDGFC